ncbi:polymorphic toxin-type HINT domain-containing protein [Cohnella ginsengisoli]|uniref:Polymorphic toxin-type HINT domain-containing protein n=1 Tax=Cohnella ginsengisoli TaxID=425004 RepID=A0A9X4QPB7_9BACL|nr:polymorphic toxin-type HINT domain-containing protein [Cohnella ginsengisoli]MDG0794164.1 polymorphic toxin-type HINT domain-containing protein [Cohnella ginsengisoli]
MTDGDYAGAIPKSGSPYPYEGEYTSADTKDITVSYWGSANTTFPTYQLYNQAGYSGALYLTGSKYQLTQTQTGFRDSSYNGGFASYITFDDGAYSGALYTTGSPYVISGSYTPASSEYFTGSCNNTIVNTYRYGVLQNTTSGSCPSSYYINSNGYVGYIPNTGTVLTSNSGTCPTTAASCTQTKVYTASYGGTLSKSAVDTRTWRQDYRGTVTSYLYYQNYRGTVTRPESDTRKWVQSYAGNIYKAGTDNFYSYSVTLNVTTNTPDTTPPSAPINLFASNITASSVNLSWSASTDDVAVSGYTIYLNGSINRSVTGTSAQITNLVPGTTYQIYIRAYDSSSNYSGNSQIVSLTTLNADNSNAPILSLNSTVDVDLPAGIYNVYRFIPASSGAFRITTGPYGGTGASNDTYLEIYSDSALTNRLAYNDDSNSTLFSAISINLNGGTTYYVKLRHYSVNTGVHARLKVAQEISYETLLLDLPVDTDIAASMFKGFKFTPQVTGSYKIYTTYYGGTNTGSSNDTYLHLYSDSDMTNQLAANDDIAGGNTLFSQIVYTMNAGTTYYIKLRHYNTTTAVHARIGVASTITSFVPLDLSGNATKSVSKPAGASEYFSFSAPSSGKYRFFTSPYQGGSADNDTILTLFKDQNLSIPLATNNDIADNPYGAHFSKIEYNLVGGTVYYVQLQPGSSSLSLATDVTVEQDSDAEQALAAPVGWEQIYTNTLSSKFDVDFYRIDVSEPTDIHLNVTANKITLLDSSGNINGIFLPDNMDSFTLPTAGVYYAKVEYYDDGTAGASAAGVGTQAIQSYALSSKKSGVLYGSDSTTTQASYNYMDGTNAANYANIYYSYWDPHDSTLVQVYTQYGVLVYEETLGYRSGKVIGSGGYPVPSTYNWSWRGNLNRNTSLAYEYDTDGDSYPDKLLAPTGIYYVKIAPTDSPGSKHPTIQSLSVVNESNYLTKLIPAPPTKLKNGATITSQNKSKCAEICGKYFVKYVWDRTEGTGQALQYDTWYSSIYGLNGLQKFWRVTGDFIYNPNKSTMDNLQQLIDLGGMIPVFGIAADGLSTVMYLAKGDEISAGISAIAMIPFYGDGIMGAKLFRRAYADNPCFCFAAGTPVKTSLGEKPIESVQIGDLVLSKNDQTGEQSYKPVEAIFAREAEETWNIYAGGEKLTTTDRHPFWVEDRGWVLASDLKVGDLLENALGNPVPIDRVEIVQQHIKLYNFTVQDFHTYYVSSLGIWTHNAICLTAADYNVKNISQYDKRLTSVTTGNILAAEMKKAGFDMPDYLDNNIKGWSAHHIIAKTAGNNPFIAEAQAILGTHGIDINSAANGVWLPRKTGVPEVEVNGVYVSTHNGYHNGDYFEEVATRLRAVKTDYNKVLGVIEDIREELLTGVLKLGNV